MTRMNGNGTTQLELQRLGIDPAAVEAALARDLTFPARWYSDPGIYEFELEKIFKYSWFWAGPLCRLREPGDLIVCQVAHVPIIIVRGRDHTLRGFVNICRHRAYPLATADGNHKRLYCRYHAWTYDLDGALHNAPRCEREAQFDPGEFSLVPVAVDTWDELVVVNPNPGALPFHTAHADFVELAAERGLTFADYDYLGRYTYPIAGNWKIWGENTSECYHCPTVHARSFSDAFDDSPDGYRYVNRGQVFGQFCSYNDSAQQYRSALPLHESNFRFIYLFPATLITQDDYVAFPGRIVPTGPETCEFVADMYLRKGIDEARAKDWIEMWNNVLLEDSAAVSAQQPGLRSRMIDHGRIMRFSESSISRFHRLVWDAIARAVSTTQ